MTLIIAYILLYMIEASTLAYVAVFFVWLLHLAHHGKG